MSIILETERLLLESLGTKHKENLFKHFSDDEVTKYMDIDTLKSMEEAENIIKHFEDYIHDKKRYRFAIIRKEDNQFLGTCGFNNWIRNFGNRSEIGYDLSKAYWGQGYMKEALKTMIHYGFETMKLKRIEAMVTDGNDRSRQLLKSLGFTEEGYLRARGYWKGQFVNEYIYSILDEE